jgi:hypothetical protein
MPLFFAKEVTIMSNINYGNAKGKLPGSTTNQQMKRKREESNREEASLKVFRMDANGNLVEQTKTN